MFGYFTTTYDNAKNEAEQREEELKKARGGELPINFDIKDINWD